MESSDMHGLVDQILRQLWEAGERATRTGMLIALPKYFDAAEVQALQQEINQKSAFQYDVTHRRGERRVWVQLR
jgi:hypothetical protein